MPETKVTKLVSYKQVKLVSMDIEKSALKNIADLVVTNTKDNLLNETLLLLLLLSRIK
jgi:hypothetical protein